MSLDNPFVRLPHDAYTRRTVQQVGAMVGRTPHLGDIVASSIEPFEPVGRIVGLGGRGFAAVTLFNGDVRTGHLGIAWTGYCPREEWDGPTPNGLLVTCPTCHPVVTLWLERDGVTRCVRCGTPAPAPPEPAGDDGGRCGMPEAMMLLGAALAALWAVYALLT